MQLLWLLANWIVQINIRMFLNFGRPGFIYNLDEEKMEGFTKKDEQVPLFGI